MTDEVSELLDYTDLIDDLPEKENQPKALAAEPLFTSLLRKVIGAQWPDDTIMADFVEHVSGPLSDYLGHVAAKGGNFAAQHLADGKEGVERYLRDQSMRAHLVNGLFPVLHIARLLKQWGAPQFQTYDDTTRRIFIAGYVFHDYLKFPDTEAILQAAGFSHNSAISKAQMPVVESLFLEWGSRLGIDRFLEQAGGIENYLHDLIYVACNTQTRWGTLRNLSLLPELKLAPVQLDLTEQLSHMADLLAYVARTPRQVVTHTTIRETLISLSENRARLVFHHVADNRGVLTNFIHRAALELMQAESRAPLLYAPSGVVYLENIRAAPALPELDQVAEKTVGRIQEVVMHKLTHSRKGFKRDGKGVKYADYYWLFFNLPTFLLLGSQATLDLIRVGKTPSAGKRFEKLRQNGWMEPGVDLDLADDLRVDQMAEWCYLAEKQIAVVLPDFDTGAYVLNMMGLDDLLDQFLAAPRDNRAGGVGYHWYFAAGHYLKRHPGLDPTAWQERIEGFARQLVGKIDPLAAELPAKQASDDWDDLRDYIRQVVTLGDATAQKQRDRFQAELDRYTNARRKGRGKTQVCASCSSPYRISKQREAGVLFAPQVYSNKLPLHGSDAIRNICSLCSMEMMLRQILMNRSAASGGDFEGRRVRYLYFYPTYFFTPETLSVIQAAYQRLRRISFTELRRQLVAKDGAVDLSPQVLQRLEALLLAPEETFDPNADRYVRMQFPDTDPVSFYFMGVPPPGRDAKDAEAWVHPALLALLIPLCLDVKIAASESSLPMFLEADEMNEMVFLDGPHAAINYLTGGANRINIDHLLPIVQRLVTAYLIHVDANSKMGAGGYDYRWQDLPALARNLDQSPLYVFHYLKKWQRQQQLDSIPGNKAHQYLIYVQHFDGGKEMSHARKLTELYRQFYRAKRYNSNSVLRPLSISARTVLEADLRLFNDAESLTEAVYGELASFSERASISNLAYFPKGITREARQKAMQEFAHYFVEEIFYGIFRGDKSALRGKQLNLLKNACETIYQEEAAREREEAQAEVENDTTIA